MAITTTQEQQNIIGLTVGLFNAAPGAQYLAELTAVYEANGNSLEALANYILSSDAFNAQYASAETNEDVIAIAVETFGVEPGTEAFEEASAFFANGLAAGRSAADLLIEAANYLNGDVDPQFADIAAQFQNKIAVATYFSVERADIEELDVAALKAVVAGVTADEESEQAAIDAVTAEYGEAPEEPTDLSDLTEALLALQAANDARDTFLIEEALQNELVQSVLEGISEEGYAELLADLEENGSLSDEQLTAIANAVNAGEGENNALDIAETAAEGALANSNSLVDDAVGVLNTYLAEQGGFTAQNDTPEVGNFDSASRTIQDTLASESQAALNEATEALEGAVGGITGLSGRINTLQTRKAEFEAALQDQFDSEEAVTGYVSTISSVDSVNIDWESNNAALTSITVVTQAEVIADGSAVPPVVGVPAVTATYDVETGEWTGDGQGDIPDSVKSELGALLNTYAEATGARATSQELFTTAIARVNAAEEVDGGQLGGDLISGFTIETVGNGDDVGAFDGLTLDLGTAAPLSQALIDLREAQVAIDEASANLAEARELSDALDGLDDGIDAAEAVFGDNFNLNLINNVDIDGDNVATSGNDLFLFAEDKDGGYEIDQFGELGQDHIFFGDTAYQLVQLQEGQNIEQRVGSATELEVFWEQDGANLVLYVESEAAAGTDLNTLNITTITLNEFSNEDVLFENGLLSTNTAPVEVA